MKYERIINQSSKPQRYIGEELNSIIKDKNPGDVKVLVGYPDLYEIGMSNMALRIFYFLVNSIEGAHAERIFTPAPDMIELLRKNNYPLTSIETKTPIKEFDLLCLTLQYELTYSAMLTILELGRIPIFSQERSDDDPLVVIGGPCATNPEPCLPFVDLISIGDGEGVFEELIEVIKNCRGLSRLEKIKEACKIEGVFSPLVEKKVKRRIIRNLDDAFHPETTIVPFMSTVHDRISIEVARGCPHGCRFCHAGFTYRPYRERSVDNIIEIAKKQVESTGYNEITLASLSASDYTQINELVEKLNSTFSGRGISISLPSLRISNFSIELAKMIGMVRRGGLTLAPEAGSDRMRKCINKGVEAEDLMESVISAARSGWKRMKLYFMLGLPGETDDDAIEIARLAIEAQKLGKKISKGGFSITISISSFVPKPHTPFQWAARIDKGSYLNRIDLIKDMIRGKNINLKYSHTFISELESIFARGDEKTSQFLYEAWKRGAIFDGWKEYINYDAWLESTDITSLNWQDYFNPVDVNKELPWDYIDMLVSKEFLIKEFEKSKTGSSTSDCNIGKCKICGAC